MLVPFQFGKHPQSWIFSKPVWINLNVRILQKIYLFSLIQWSVTQHKIRKKVTNIENRLAMHLRCQPYISDGHLQTKTNALVLFAPLFTNTHKNRIEFSRRKQNKFFAIL